MSREQWLAALLYGYAYVALGLFTAGTFLRRLDCDSPAGLVRAGVLWLFVLPLRLGQLFAGWR